MTQTAESPKKPGRFSVREITYISPGAGIGTLTFTSMFRQAEKAGIGNVGFMTANLFDRRVGTGWKYLHCHDMHWLADGKPVDLGETSHTGRAVPGGTIEVMQQNATLSDLKRLADAKVLEFRVCSTEGTLSTVDLEGLRQLYQHAAGAPPAPDPSAKSRETAPAAASDCEACKKIGGG